MLHRSSWLSALPARLFCQFHLHRPIATPFLPPTPAERAKEVLRENVSMPLLMRDLFDAVPCLRPLKVGGRGCCPAGAAH